MAAGIGSRFGGVKQLVGVGPDGETFLDFAITDAGVAGADRVVMVVRSQIEDDVRRHVEARHPGLDITYVRQDDHGPPRPKPWGTAHAVLATASVVTAPFVVCNADDYYGATTYPAVADRLGSLALGRAALCGFRLDRTLPALGSVSRGICTVEGGRLMGIVEHHGVARCPDTGEITAATPAVALPGAASASMNLWAFETSMFDWLDSGFSRFLDIHGHDEQAEYLLPVAVAEKMADGSLTVEVVPTEETWVGVTNPADLDVARRTITALRRR